MPRYTSLVLLGIIIPMISIVLFLKANDHITSKFIPTYPDSSVSKLTNNSINLLLNYDTSKAFDPDDTITYKKITIDSLGKWVMQGPNPKKGAILPNNRIIAYYGNLYSTRMGILGELEPDQVLEKLQGEVKAWNTADSSKKAIPALHLIVTTAQSQPGKDEMYRLRMPFKMIDSVLAMAKKIQAIVFLDIQPGHSCLEKEIPFFEKYLKLPQVHLGIDPEFAMNKGSIPGQKIGSLSAEDINYASAYLQNLVKENNLPPKVLIVHRFTKPMVKNHEDIKLNRNVQIIIHMDGWGSPVLKKSTYKRYIYKEPVQYTGIKLFYKNDTKKGDSLMNHKEILSLYPQPLYIQYQ